MQPAHAVCSVGPPLLSPPHHRLSRPPCGACCCWVGGTGDVGGSTTLGGKGVHGDADAVAVHQHGKGMQCHGKGCSGMLRGGSSMLRGHHSCYGGCVCLARRLAHGLDRGAAGLARHQLAEFVKVDCEGMRGCKLGSAVRRQVGMYVSQQGDSTARVSGRRALEPLSFRSN